MEPIVTTLARTLKLNFKDGSFPITIDEFLYLIN